MNMQVFRAKVNYYIDNPPFAARKEDNEVAFDDIKRMYSSRVQGSKFKGRPIDYLLNADAHAFVSRANTEKILKRLDAIEEELKQNGNQ